jgi:hypothetical protein
MDRKTKIPNDSFKILFFEVFKHPNVNISSYTTKTPFASAP